MEGKNIPLIIMLSAGSVISIACIVYDFGLLETLIVVLATLVGFYLIGQIVKKIILSINKNAEERAALLASQSEEEQAVAEAEGAQVTVKPETEETEEVPEEE